MVELQRVYWIAVKHVLCYLRGTLEYELLYERSGGVKLVGFIDADWEGCAEENKSTLGCCFNIGSSIISWFNRKHISMALRSIEVEYMAASLAACEALWLRMLLLGLFKNSCSNLT